MAKTTKKKKVTKKASAKKAASVTKELFDSTGKSEKPDTQESSSEKPVKVTKRTKKSTARTKKAKEAKVDAEPTKSAVESAPQPNETVKPPKPVEQQPSEQKSEESVASDSPKKEATPSEEKPRERDRQQRHDGDHRNRNQNSNQNQNQNQQKYNRSFRNRRGNNGGGGGKYNNGRNQGGGGHYNQGNQGGGSYSGGSQQRERPQHSDAQLDAETQARYEQAKQADTSMRDLQKMEIEQLVELGKTEKVENYAGLSKQDLIFNILKQRIKNQGLMYGEGVLEILPDGFGFLRSPEYSYLACPDDIYVSPAQIRRFGLKPGHIVQGTIRPPKESEKYFALLRIDAVNGQPPDHLNDIRNFEDLTPLHPSQRFILEQGDGSKRDISMRIVDLVTPIGRGQRGLIVAPPRTGKTVMMQSLANSIINNYPDCKVIVLLIDERPEEVTDFRQNTPSGVEIIASTFDEQTSRHVQVCEMVIEKSRRAVEFGEHVVILMDSLTRMARAYNQEMPHSGKILTGGLDANALQRPRKFLGSARAIENGGSLTIIATALVDTGSKMDDIIFEEFKGTGNMELHLDRRLVEKRTYPAIDIAASGTRREELLMDPRELDLTYRLRKVLADMNVVEAMELLKGRIERVKTNAEFLLTMNLD